MKTYKLFDYLAILFSKSTEFDALNNNERSNYYFMTNRLTAIMYPQNANKFNHLDIDTGNVVNSYHDMFKNIGGIPSYISKGIRPYAGSKKEKKITEKYVPTDELVNKYCELSNIGYKEYERLFILYKDDVIIELKELEESLKI